MKIDTPNTHRHTSRLIASLAFALIASFNHSLVTAQAAKPATSAVSPAEFLQVAEIEREVTLPNGKKELKRSKADKVAPGETVVYTSRIKNNSDQALADLKVDAPIPKEMTWIDGSVFGDITPTYSVDGGKLFAALSALTVTENNRVRPAKPSDVTHLRLLPKQALAANQTLVFGYKAMLK